MILLGKLSSFVLGRVFSSPCTPVCIPSSPVFIPFQWVSRGQWLRNIFQHKTECNYDFHFTDKEIEKLCGVSPGTGRSILKFSSYLFNVGYIFLDAVSSLFHTCWCSHWLELHSFLCLTWHWNGILFLLPLLIPPLSQSQWDLLLELLYGIRWHAGVLELFVFGFCDFWGFEFYLA